jgi:tetratricopeptide (TPR) repeat protein
MAGLPPQAVALLQAAARAIRDREAARAEALLRDAGERWPEHPEALRLLGILRNRQERWDEAVGAFHRALAQRPDDGLTLSGLGTALTGAGRPEEGLSAWRRACGLEPDDAMLWFNLGRNLQQAGKTAEAVDALSRAVALEPRALPAHVLLADARVHLGLLEEARQSYRTALGLDPACGDAWRGLSNLKTLPLEDAELALLESLRARPQVSPLDRIAMGLARGKALEDRGRYAEAFEAVSEANAQTRALGAWDAQAFSSHVDRVIAATAHPTCTAPSGLGREVIFVVSLPRSGSTLVEQILAAHPEVEGASELTDLEAVLEEESRRREIPFPEWVRLATAEDFARLGHGYLARTARWRQDRPRHTDKMPDNWLYVGVLGAMLPGAAVVDVRRDPVEVGWSCFKQQFYRVPHFSNALGDIAAYLREHDRALATFAEAPSGRLRIQHYEALVGDPEGEVRALLAFCGLPFDPACLAFHQARRSVRTASAAQVRQPLRGDTARALRYGALLDPLRSALGLPADG